MTVILALDLKIWTDNMMSFMYEEKEGIVLNVDMWGWEWIIAKDS